MKRWYIEALAFGGTAVVILGMFFLGLYIGRSVQTPYGNWSISFQIPECGEGDVVGKPANKLHYIQPERSGDYLTVSCDTEGKTWDSQQK